MFKKSYLLLLVAAFFICLSTVTANADVIFSDLPSSGAQYAPASAASVFGSSIGGGPLTPAAQFKADGTGSINVTQIDVAVDSRFNPISSGNFQVQIWASSLPLGAGIPTGTALYTSPKETPIGVYGDVNDLFTISGITGLSLTGGQTYFMSVNPFGPTDDAAWHRNVVPDPAVPTGPTQGLVLDFNGTAWIPAGTPYLPAFDILGSAPVTGVPEPCTMLLLGLGLVGLAGLRRKIQ